MGGAAGAAAVPAGDRRPAADVAPTPRRARRCSRVRRHHAARRGAVDRRGVPRRARAAADRRARRSRSPSGCDATVRERVGLPITVGVARTKFLAKVASGVAKPDGLLVVPPDRELAFLHPLPVERLWGVGRGDRREAPTPRDRDGRRGRARSPRRRSSRCSAARPGRHLHALAHNRDPRPVQRGPPARLDRLAARARPLAEVAGRDRRRRWSGSSTASPAGCEPRAASAARSCCGCASTTSRARPARTRCRARPRTPQPILATARELLAAAMPMIERAGPHARRHRRREPRRRRRRPARAAVRPPRAAARSTPRSTRSASASGRTAITPRGAARPRPRASRCRCFPTDLRRSPADEGLRRGRAPVPRRTAVACAGAVASRAVPTRCSRSSAGSGRSSSTRSRSPAAPTIWCCTRASRDYDPAWCDELYERREIFEAYNKGLSLVHASEFPWFRGERWPTAPAVLAENAEVAKRVLERIRAEGPLSSLDFERERGSDDRLVRHADQHRARACSRRTRHRRARARAPRRQPPVLRPDRAAAPGRSCFAQDIPLMEQIRHKLLSRFRAHGLLGVSGRRRHLRRARRGEAGPAVAADTRAAPRCARSSSSAANSFRSTSRA